MRNQPPYVRIIGIRFIGYDLNRLMPVPPLVICVTKLNKCYNISKKGMLNQVQHDVNDDLTKI